MRLLWAVWLIPLLIIGGCADSSTQGDSNLREYRDLVVIRDNPGTVHLTVNLAASSEQETSTTQDTANTSELSPKVSLGLQGGTAALADTGATFMMDGISSLFQQWQDKKKYDSDNTTTADTVTVPPVKEENVTVVDKPEITPTLTCIPEDASYHGKTNGDRPTWYFSKNMTEYPSSFKINVKDCTELEITNDGSRWEDNDSSYVLKQSEVAGRGMGLVGPSSCVSESASIVCEEVEEVESEVDTSTKETEFHHVNSNWSSGHGGQALVLCLGQDLMFDKCAAGSVNIPYHGKDKDRLTFWNMNEYSNEDIVCEKDGKTYIYPTKANNINYGTCP